MCKNDVIVRCDADDVNTIDRLSITREKFLNNPNLHLLGGSIIENYGNGVSRLKLMPQGMSEIKRYAFFRNPFNHMTVAFRKETVVKLGGYPNIPFKEDFSLWLLFIYNRYYCENVNQVFSFVDASNGMIKRRKSFSAIVSEFKFFLFRTKNNLGNGGYSFFSMLVRVCILCFPLFLLKLFYLEKLRQKSND